MNTGNVDIVKRAMERTRVEILGISELKWTEMGRFNRMSTKCFSVVKIMPGEIVSQS